MSCTVGPCFLSFLHIIICICESQAPNPSLPSPNDLATTSLFSMSVCCPPSWLRNFNEIFVSECTHPHALLSHKLHELVRDLQTMKLINLLGHQHMSVSRRLAVACTKLGRGLAPGSGYLYQCYRILLAKSLEKTPSQGSLRRTEDEISFSPQTPHS